jgi:hypothetical protein
MFRLGAEVPWRSPCSARRLAPTSLSTACAGHCAGRASYLPVRVPSRLFRRLFLEKLLAAHQADRISSSAVMRRTLTRKRFTTYLAPYAKPSGWLTPGSRLAEPQLALACLSHYAPASPSPARTTETRSGPVYESPIPKGDAHPIKVTVTVSNERTSPLPSETQKT